MRELKKGTSSTGQELVRQILRRHYAAGSGTIKRKLVCKKLSVEILAEPIGRRGAFSHCRWKILRAAE